MKKLKEILFIFRETKNNQQGFSLFEMLVAITIFILLMLTATDIFQMMLKTQSKFISEQASQESVRFAMEMMSKEIRFAKRSDGACGAGALFPDNRVFTTTDNSVPLHWDDLVFLNKNNVCVRYYLNNHRLMLDRGGSIMPATPDEVSIDNLKFDVADNLTTDTPGSLDQPVVTVKMDVTAPGSNMFKIQTTISSRNYVY